MRIFNYLAIDSELYTPDIVNLVSAIHEYKGKQDLFIEGIYTSEARLNKLVIEKAEPTNRNEQEIAGYREVLNTIH